MHFTVLATGLTRGNLILLMIMVSIIVLLLASAFILKARQKKGLTYPAAYGGKKTDKKRNMEDTGILLSGIEDIRDGIIVTDKNTRFVSAIRCTGYDFYSDTLEGKTATMAAFQRFFTTIREPVTFRTSSKIIDVEKPLNKYTARINELNGYAEKLKAEIDAGRRTSEDLAPLYRELDTVSFRINHLKMQLDRIKRLSSGDVISDTTQVYVFDWRFRQADYSYTMSDDEIFATARTALADKAANMIRELSDAHVKGKVLTQSEMVELCRQYARPFTSEIYPERMVEDSNFFDEIQKSASFEETNGLLEQVLHDEKMAEFYESLAQKESDGNNPHPVSGLFV